MRTYAIFFMRNDSVYPFLIMLSRVDSVEAGQELIGMNLPDISPLLVYTDDSIQGKPISEISWFTYLLNSPLDHVGNGLFRVAPYKTDY